jgi:lambda family phage minor tail protein L
MRFPITHDYVSENTQGAIDTLKVRISNVSREIQAYLELYELRNKKVEVLIVFANQLEDPGAYIKDTYYIDAINVNEQVVEFTLTSKFDLLDANLPSRTYSRNYCSWKFKSTECGYTGAEVSCNKTFQRCKELNNRLRFGGFPSIPSRRIYAS